jgi:hypothetical protein
MEKLVNYKANRNILFKDLLSPKYRMRKIEKKNAYNRKQEKTKTKSEINGYYKV